MKISKCSFIIISCFLFIFSCRDGELPLPKLEKVYLQNNTTSTVYYVWHDFHPNTIITPESGYVNQQLEQLIGDSYLGNTNNGWYISDLSLALYADALHTKLIADKTTGAYSIDGEAVDLPKEGETYVRKIVVTQDMMDRANNP